MNGETIKLSSDCKIAVRRDADGDKFLVSVFRAGRTFTVAVSARELKSHKRLLRAGLTQSTVVISREEWQAVRKILNEDLTERRVFDHI